MSAIWTSAITCYDSIADILDIRIAASVPEQQRSLVIHGVSCNLVDFVTNFLKGTGIPLLAALDITSYHKSKLTNEYSSLRARESE